jgi:hypothetical protein
MERLLTEWMFCTATRTRKRLGVPKSILRETTRGKVSRISRGSAKRNEEAAIRAALSFLEDRHS